MSKEKEKYVAHTHTDNISTEEERLERLRKKAREIWPGRDLNPGTTAHEKAEAEAAAVLKRFRQKDHEIWPGPDESDCPTSLIAEQLQELTLKMDELEKVLNDLGYRLAPVLKGEEAVLPQNPTSEESPPKCSSDLGRLLAHDVDRIAELKERVVQILHRLEI